MNYPSFWLNASPKMKRFYSVMFMLVMAVLALMIGFMVPVGPTEAQLISDQLNQTVTEGVASGTLTQAIFVNNFLLCLVMFIPLAGAAMGLFILFSTGQAFRAVLELQTASLSGATATPTPSAAALDPGTAGLLLVMVGVVFVLEFVAYSVGMAESIWLFRRISTLKNLKAETKYLLLFIGLVALMLIVGAVVENYAITLGL